MSTTGQAHAIDAVADEVSQSLAGVDRMEFDLFVNELRVPQRRWYCTGQGRSGLVARMAAMRLMHLGHRSHVVGEATAPSITSSDILLILSSSGTTPVSRHFAETARHVGAAVILVTATPQSPLRDLAHTTLKLPAARSTQFGGSLFEQAALLVLDAAILAVDAEDQQTRKTMQSRHANLQ
ncbi:MAG: 6-phospho-3-hexuloisomerase [Ornithinimicrobium sp.]